MSGNVNSIPFVTSLVSEFNLIEWENEVDLLIAVVNFHDNRIQNFLMICVQDEGLYPKKIFPPISSPKEIW